MSSRSSIFKLPKADQDALFERLRASNYGAIDYHLAWLKAQGHDFVSRSALARFIASLRLVDAGAGKIEAQLVALKSRPRRAVQTTANRMLEISERLATISAEQAELIAEFGRIVEFSGGRLGRLTGAAVKK